MIAISLSLMHLSVFSVGANRMQIATWSILPQIGQDIASYAMYAFEINIRAAAILGYVGAGGLGVLINERIGWRDYEGLGTVLLMLFILVLLIDQLSTFLRSKLS